ncbi:MAG: 6-hydroxycyclohex-1-ene-1-carbonyl-CoA dehydrogenase [Terriglobales bacterium]
MSSVTDTTITANHELSSRAIHGAYGFRLMGVGQRLEPYDFPTLKPGPDQVVVKVAGCGVCHTDIGYAFDGVPTRHPLPLILGHEIAGRVVAAGEKVAHWQGQTVIVPAVIPCGECPACKAGRATICRKQFMPGNDGDGGFATHLVVPGRGLCPVPDKLPDGLTLAALSVVADAVTTPYEAIRRAQLGPNDSAVFTGVGGIGGFGVQIAAALGAAVVAIDVDQERLNLAAQHGASLTLDASQMNDKDLKSAVRSFVKQSGKSGIGLKIFETSGTAAGQTTAFSLIDHGGYLAVVGYSPKPVEVRLSNLMAFDATARGNWGCPPEQYPPALALVLEGKVALQPYVEEHSLGEAPEVLEAVHKRAIRRRAILIPPSH